MPHLITDSGERGSRDGLFVTTLLYLTVPTVLFFLGWLRPWLGIVLTALAVAGIADAWRRSRREHASVSRPQLVLALALALFWAVASGIGAINPQTTDYNKHNLVFHDLVVNEWPVVYLSTPGTPVLTYYLAYYLPASLTAKAVGVEHTDLLSLAWAWSGIALAFAWFLRLGAPHGTVVLLLVLLIDGLCWLPGLLRLAYSLGWLVPPPGALASGDAFTIEFWEFGGPWTRLLFGSEVDNLRFAPQHLLAAWLGTACVLRTLLERRSARHLVLAHGSLVLWSPFVAVGLAPFTALALRHRRPEAFAWPNLAGVTIAVPICLYYLGHQPHQYLGWLFANFSGVADWLRYLAFLLLAVGALYGAVWLARRRYGVPNERLWQVVSLAALVAIATTLVYLGRYNDWAMRTSMPATLALRLGLALTAVQLWRAKARRLHLALLAGLLVLSAERPIKAWILIPSGQAGGLSPATSVAAEGARVGSLPNLPRSPEWDYPSQYLGSSRSFFARHLMAAPGER